MDNQQNQTPPPQPQPPMIPPPYPSHTPFLHLLQQQQHQHLQMFWSYQRQEIEHATDFKNHLLPLARIKKIMKADEDVRMISAEAPVLFAKACELFILELTIRSWLHAEENKRRTLQKNDIAAAITRTDIFDFLVDIVPRDEGKEEGGAAAGVALGGSGGGSGGGVLAAEGVPYYYPPMGQPAVMPQGMDPAYGQPPWQAAMWRQQPQNDGGSYGGGPSMDGSGYSHPNQGGS